MKLFIIFLLIISCGYFSTRDEEREENSYYEQVDNDNSNNIIVQHINEIKVQSQESPINLNEIVESKSKIKLDGGESMLWVSLRYYAIKKLGFEDPLLNYEDFLNKTVINGEIFRGTNNEERNTSRDMVTGFLLAMTQYPKEKALPILLEVAKFWENNNDHITNNCDKSNIGKDDFDEDGCDNRRDVSGNIRYLLGRVIAFHGGEVPEYCNVMSVITFPQVNDGFPQHLQALQLLFLKEIDEFGIRASLAAKWLASQQSKNALFQAINDNKSEAEILLNEQFPNGHHYDYRQEYIYQRADHLAYEIKLGSNETNEKIYLDYLMVLAAIKE